MPPLPYATLFEVVLRLARELVLVRQGTATAGTTTTLDDSLSLFPLDTFRGGSLFLLNDSVFRTIIQHAGGKFTFAAVSLAPDVGDRYAASDNDVPLDVLVESINSAIRSMTLPGEDITLVTVSGQGDYTLPANVSGIFSVEIASSLTTPFLFTENFHWDEVNGHLRFPSAFAPATAGNVIRLTFRRPHTDIVLESAAIPNDINLDFLHWTAVQIASKYGQHVHGDDPKRNWPAKIQESEVRIQRFSSMQPKLQRAPRLADY